MLQCLTWHSLREKKPKLTEVKISIHRRLKSANNVGKFMHVIIDKKIAIRQNENHHHGQSEQHGANQNSKFIHVTGHKRGKKVGGRFLTLIG